MKQFSNNIFNFFVELNNKYVKWQALALTIFIFLKKLRQQALQGIVQRMHNRGKSLFVSWLQVKFQAIMHRSTC